MVTGTVAPVETPGMPGPALTAAVSTVVMDGASWRNYRFGNRAWQDDAWRLYDITGQLRFVANWVGNSISRCPLYVAEVDDNGEAAERVDDPEVAQLAAVPLGSGPAKDEALRLAGINLYVPGECYIVAEADGNGPGEDRWWVVSGRQVKRQGTKIVIKRSQLQGGGSFEFRDGVDLLLRVWTPHPAEVDEPDSPARSAIPDLREIEALRKREFAELDSRLSGAGLLALPDDLEFPRGDDDPAGMDGFAALLMRTMATSLQDRSSAAAMVPIMVQGPAASLEQIRHITFWTELSAQVLPLREAAIRSLAQSLDIPPEVMLGLGSANHWSAWAISEEAITTQIKPVLSRIADALTTGYLRPALEAMGLDPARYVYEFDTAPLTTRPNRVADATSYHDKLLISDEAAREAGAWNDDDAPTDDERLRRLVERAVQGSPSLLGDPVVQAILGLPALAAAAGNDDGGGDGDGGDGDGGDGGGETGPPADQPDNTDTPPAAAALLAVSNLAVHRALALAGGRLVSHRHRDRYPGTPRHELHVRHGPVDRARAHDVLRGAWDELAVAAEDLDVDPRELAALLDGYVTELLTRGMAHHRDLVRDLLATAVLPPARMAVAA